MSFEQFKTDMVKAIEYYQAKDVKLIYGLNYVYITENRIVRRDPCGLCALFMLHCFLTNEKAENAASVFSKISERYGIQGLAAKFVAGFDTEPDDESFPRNDVYLFGQEIRKGAISGPTLNEELNYEFQVWSGDYHFEGFISKDEAAAKKYVESLKEIGGKAYVVRALKGTVPGRDVVSQGRSKAFPHVAKVEQKRSR